MSTTAKQLAKFQRALAQAAEIFDDVDVTTVVVPLESVSDKVREAASVIAYFDMREKFRKEICRSCRREFVYCFYHTAVKCCSIPCMAAHLATLGLKWDPSAPLERRWGPKGVPAIVPAVVYETIKEQTPQEEEPAPTVVINNETTNLIADLDALL